MLDGGVLGPDGNPAEGVVVVSSAGGRTVTDAAGRYRIEVDVPEASSVRITAVAEGLFASSSLSIGGAARLVRVDPLQLVRGDSCSPEWIPTFGGEPGTNDWILAMTVYDDGSGPALFAGGTFTTAGGKLANGIARWDGSSWSALGSGVGPPPQEVTALAVYDDGGGPALYVGGNFITAGGVAASHIARWDGSSWSKLGSGMDDAVNCLTVYDDGGGPALYAGGTFLRAGGALANSIAKWNGSSWSSVGGGLGCCVHDLAVYDDGSGPALYAGGSFQTAGGARADGIAKWDGSNWSPLGSGVAGWIGALAVHDDGSGPALYAGGNFMTADGLQVNHIARWDGSSWSALANGMGNNHSIVALAVYDDGGGPGLYVGGATGAGNVKKWDGSTWSVPARGVNDFVGALAVYDDGSGPALYAGGTFTKANDVPARRIARWDGASWSALGRGLLPAVNALAVYDEGSGPALYAGGNFTVGGVAPAERIAKWNGSSWSALGGGFGGTVRAMVVFDDGGGPDLYAGGDSAVAAIAKWDGWSWSALDVRGMVRALAVHDDGGGPALFAGGGFSTAGGVTVNRIARWDGSQWSALGSGMNGEVWALAVHDDGDGPALYAGGTFTVAGGASANHIAKWDGSGWSALSEGVNDPEYTSSVSIYSLASYDDGNGQALYAAGFFSTAGGVPANHIAKWNGSRWSALGSGLQMFTYPNTRIYSLAVHDDGAGPAIYAGGNFDAAGGMAANFIARWDGTSWAPLGSGLSSAVRAMVVFDGPDRGGPALFVGGDFSSAFDSGDSYVARWQGCPDRTPPVLQCPVSVKVPDPRSGPPGEVVTFTVTASDGRDASPSIVCSPPSGSLFPPGVTLVQCKATDGARNQASCSFPVLVQRK